jgi:hypothetical protein
MPETKTSTMFSLATLKDYLKATGTGHDATIVRIGDGVSEKIESLIKRQVVKRSVTETKSGTNTGKLQLLYFPIASVESAKYRFTLLDAWINLDVVNEVEIDAFRGYLLLKQLFWPKGPQLVQVAYTAGFGTKDDADGNIPADIFGAGLDFAKWCYDRWKSDTISTSSLTVSGGGSAMLVPGIPNDVKEALEGWAPLRI